MEDLQFDDRTLGQKMRDSMATQSIIVKMVVITLVALALLLPTSFVSSIIEERQALEESTINDVSREWANAQSVVGPILTIPVTSNDSTSPFPLQVIPERLNITGRIEPQTLHRGIYDVVVYTTRLNISGTFRPPHTSMKNASGFKLQDSYLTLGISDRRGIADKLDVRLDGRKQEVESGVALGSISSGVTVRLDSVPLADGKSVDVAGQPFGSDDDLIPFTIQLELQGSRELKLIPLARAAEVHLDAPWSDPSFSGAFLPHERQVSDTGFAADWTVLEENRGVPPSWRGTSMPSDDQSASIGVELLSGVNDYVKSIRAVKYAILVIAFTFIIFFLIEITGRRQIHPFQYLLVGFALSLFYLLLVAISEQTGFNIAYAIAAGGVTGMIGLYSIPAFRSLRHTLLLVASLIGTYGFLFVILQLEGYALLVGSVSLALLLAATMYFTRNINWYRLGRTGSAVPEGAE